MWSLIFVFTCLALFSVPAHSLLSELALGSKPIALPLHTFIPRADGANGTSHSGLTSVSMSSDRQSYFTVVKIGEIFFRVALDTASSDLWILTSDCQSKFCANTPRYPRNYHSPTFVAVSNNSTLFNVSYLDGTVASGFVAKERVQLADLSVANQAFGMMTESNLTLLDQTSGIMGLGFSRLSSIPNTATTNSTPFLVTLAQQGLITYPMFGLSLTQNASGTLSIGAIDSSVVKNASLVHWNRVVDFGPRSAESNTSSYLQWAITISNISIDGTRVGLSPTYPNVTSNTSLALIDIGSPGIYGPVHDVAQLFSLVSGARLVDQAGLWAVPCDTAVTMNFTFGTRNYILNPSDYIIGPASGNPNLCLTWPRATAPSPDGIDWQIGAAFLRKVYTIFSYGINANEPPLIGLYPLSSSNNVTTVPNGVLSPPSALSTHSTIATTLPNFLLPTPTFTTPLYAFNASISHLPHGIASSDLGTSTYSPVLGTHTTFNASALPAITPSPSLVTFILTNSAGIVITSTSTVVEPSASFGVPPGWNAASSLCVSSLTIAFTLIIPWTIFYVTVDIVV